MLFIRKDCLLCENLAKHLRLLSLPFSVIIVDIDSHPQLKARYTHRVPILVQRFNTESNHKHYELPSISPRSVKANLIQWLKYNMHSE